MRKRHCTLVVALLLVSFSARGQWHETFDSLPALDSWHGDTDAFTVVGGWLRLDDDTPTRPVAIWHPLTIADTIEWRITVRMPFPPSNANHARIYLLTDSTDPTASRGYYLRLGRNGSADAIELYRQDGTARFLVGKGADSTIAGGLADVRIIVQYRHPGQWNVYSTASGSLQPEFTARDTFTERHGAFGIFCQHTASRRQAFFFDDLYAGPPPVDTLAPALVKADARDSLTVILYFNEAIAGGAPTDTQHFALAPSRPIRSVSWQDSAAVLHLGAALTPRRHYTAHAYAMADTAGNIRPADSSRFLYYVPRWGDLRLNELMADPTPPVGLPTAEYVEIFNTTPWAIPLAGWQLSDPARTATLTEDTIAPSAFLILTASPDLFSTAPVMGLQGFPSLNNNNDRLTLQAPDSTLVDSVSYQKTWHEPAKQDGGWSLERISPFNDCAGPENWTSSTDAVGGTPGMQNAVFNPSYDTTPPAIREASFLRSDLLMLSFSERIFRKGPFRISSHPALPSFSDSLSPDQRTLFLHLRGSVPGNVDYHITLDSLRDCWGNTGSSAVVVRWPAPVPSFPFSVRITELMPDPAPPVMLPPTEYVELYNRTDDTVELWQWQLSDGSRTATFPPHRLPPRHYLLLINASDSSQWRQAGYPFMALENFPSLNNDEDSLILTDPTGTIIDAVKYGPDWYARNPLKAEGGWAFELQNPAILCRTAHNWHFSEALEGGTPAMPNTYEGFTDTLPPMPRGVVILDTTTVRIRFSESLPPDLIGKTTTYTIDANSHPLRVRPDSLYYRHVQLTLPTPLQPGHPHIIKFTPLKDCANHAIRPDSVLVGLATPPAPGQLVISELLTAPSSVEFIEIHNTTDVLLSVSGLVLFRMDSTGPVGPGIFLDEYGNAMPPDAYWAFARSASAVRSEYTVPRPDWLFSATGLILPDDAATLGLLTRQGDTLDLARYAIAHQRPPFISDPAGLSLERIDPTLPGDQLDSWRFATTAIRATPTAPNSQRLPPADTGTHNAPAWLEYYTLTPNGDGDRDLLRIHYRLHAPGFFSTLSIFNRQGQRVFEQTAPDYLSASGTVEWMPRTRTHQLLPPGLYFGIWEYYHPGIGEKGVLRFSFSVIHP